MGSRVSRPSLWAAVGAFALVAAGCSSPGSTAMPAKPKPPVSARQAIVLAVRDVASWRSDICTTTITGIANGVRISYALTFRDDSRSFHELTLLSYKRDGKDILPGGSDSVVTPTVDYIRSPDMSRYLHTTKPWVELTAAALDSIGAKVHSSIPDPPGAFFGNAMLEVELITTSTDVRSVGTRVVNGVPVTEYQGSYSAAGALDYLKANLGSAFSAPDTKRVTDTGLTTVRFRVWLGPQHRLRKLVFIEVGTHANLTVTQTTASVNQPADIQFPLASETYVVQGTPQV